MSAFCLSSRLSFVNEIYGAFAHKKLAMGIRCIRVQCWVRLFLQMFGGRTDQHPLNEISLILVHFDPQVPAPGILRLLVLFQKLIMQIQRPYEYDSALKGNWNSGYLSRVVAFH